MCNRPKIHDVHVTLTEPRAEYLNFYVHMTYTSNMQCKTQLHHNLTGDGTQNITVPPVLGHQPVGNLHLGRQLYPPPKMILQCCWKMD